MFYGSRLQSTASTFGIGWPLTQLAPAGQAPGNLRTRLRYLGQPLQSRADTAFQIFLNGSGLQSTAIACWPLIGL